MGALIVGWAHLPFAGLDGGFHTGGSAVAHHCIRILERAR